MASLNMSYDEVINLNRFKALLLLDGLKAVEAEKYLMELKIASNHLLLNNKKHSSKFDDLRKELVKIYRNFGLKTFTVSSSFFTLENMKGALLNSLKNKTGSNIKKKTVKRNIRNNKLKSEVKK